MNTNLHAVKSSRSKGLRVKLESPMETSASARDQLFHQTQQRERINKRISGTRTIASIFVLGLLCVGNIQNLDWYIDGIKEKENISVSTTISTQTQQKQDDEHREKETLLHAQPMEKIAPLHTNNETSSSLKIAHYEFPSLQQRLQYYMGDWYNKPNWTLPDSDCKLLREETDYLRVHGEAIMMHTSQIKKCIHKHARKGMKKYCRNAYDVISNTLGADSKNNRWIFHFGDNTQIKESLPIVTKARQSALSKAPQPIVWLLNKERHYKDLEDYQSKIVKEGKEVPWSEKLPKVFWRGTTTGNRFDNLARWVNYDDGHTDIAFSNVAGAFSNTAGFQHKYVKSQYFRQKQSLLEMNRYKYLLSVEGNDVATGLKWMLYSNSVVFMSRPTVATWAMEDLLVPFVHYIPLANDYSNLLDMIKWANEHDDACQEISKRATDFIKHLWISKQAKKDTAYLQKALVTSYVNQFDSALSTCASTDAKQVTTSDSSNKHLSAEDESKSSKMSANTSHLPPHSSAMSRNRECKIVALILFGVPVHFEHIWNLYMTNIVKRNPHIHFEVSMHMYSDLHEQPLTSIRNKINATVGARTQAPDVVREILGKGSISTNMTTSSQSTFDELELSWMKQSDTRGFRNYPLQTLKNMLRQGNSLKKSFLQLQAQNHSNDDIDLYIFARSDTLLVTPIDIPCSGIGGNDIWIPSWGSYRGVNDRFAIAGRHAAEIYASRVDGYKKVMLARRANAKAYRKIVNSETLLKHWLKSNSLDITPMGDNWARLSRVRVHGMMHHRDHASHIANLSNGTIRLDREGKLHNVHVAAVAEKLLESSS